MARFLTDGESIRQWAEARAGNPMLEEIPDPVAGSRVLLQISFGQHALNADRNEGPHPPTGGFDLVTWDEWLAELDRQGLVLKVNDDVPGLLDNDFRFVARDEAGQTTPAARQPAALTVDRPHRDAAEDDQTGRKARFAPGSAQGRDAV